ncbi:hypothetical protein F6X50_19820 [Dickeya dianthicola]|jgi:uncharacterized membrane protein|uniref:Uncharacterized protein n=1 Tax=Dickeya undicola TaxID=1577887 RepID=A0A3N0FT00_9GAMM|nr:MULTISPECIES: hypothetical protein [Dickeya]ATO34580.1 hypothetical protein DDI_3412 [Dickeya dianthicola RNS04.9]MBP2848761.1 hypothetical protein [Dickeya oryzae]MCA7001810.1 hypothetical protein [Dickeya dianthicola]MCI4155093.1 hypothetical protein [Dickeya dianthicola]MCI4239391.1 hypothetical protein [Dickeya dianthicola]
MENALTLLKGMLVTAIGGLYIYLLVRWGIYTAHTSSDTLMWVVMMLVGAAVLSVVMVPVIFILQPVIALLAIVFAAISSLVSRLNRRRRSHA